MKSYPWFEQIWFAGLFVLGICSISFIFEQIHDAIKATDRDDAIFSLKLAALIFLTVVVWPVAVPIWAVLLYKEHKRNG